MEPSHADTARCKVTLRVGPGRDLAWMARLRAYGALCRARSHSRSRFPPRKHAGCGSGGRIARWRRGGVHLTLVAQALPHARSGAARRVSMDRTKMQLDLEISTLCGQLLVGGFAGAEPPARFLAELSAGRRGGAILFRRNLPDLEATARLCQAIADAAPPDLPPFLGVDQEGGRVTRLPKPFLTLPPARALGELGDADLVHRAARAVGVELRALGFNLDFAPVLDVDSNPQNPVIGDRSFGRDPEAVSERAVAFLRGLQDEGVLACGKHFPGHGDTDKDSHFDLPRIAHGRPRLDRVELPPFRAAAAAGLASMMSAHVVVEALDPGAPATLSRAVCTGLLREEIGYEGVLFSDDMEMGAIAARYPIEEAVVQAIAAGCDAVLVCKDEDAQDRAHAALVARAERDGRFRDRCVEAAARGLRARRSCPPRPLALEAMRAVVGGPASRALGDELAARAARATLQGTRP